MTRAAPSGSDFLLALAAGCERGVSVNETLALIARAGPASARLARRLSEELRGGSLAAALTAVGLIATDEQPILALAEEHARLGAALRWAARQQKESGERRQTIRNAVIGPLVLAMAGLAAEPLPQLILGNATLWTALRPALALGAAVTLALFLLSRVKIRDGEAEAAGLISLFADAGSLALAPRAARAISAPWADALAAVAADPRASVPMFSEPFALALQVGIGAADLPARFAAVHDEAEKKSTSRLRAIARVLAFVVLGMVALHGAVKLLSSPLPGVGGDLNLPELKELEQELENAGH
jgi:hypothetical protein